jgi:Major tropism determinant N-terminal domain
MPRIALKRGLKANLPSTGLLAGEPLITTDRGTLHIATSATTKIPVVPAHEDLPIMPAVDGVADLLMMYDASETATQKEKSISFNNFKVALNIPPASSDEKVAVISGGTSGFLWGTNGTDGVVRMNVSMSWSKDAGNGFVTLAVGDVDCGTF